MVFRLLPKGFGRILPKSDPSGGRNHRRRKVSGYRRGLPERADEINDASMVYRIVRRNVLVLAGLQGKGWPGGPDRRRRWAGGAATCSSAVPELWLSLGGHGCSGDGAPVIGVRWRMPGRERLSRHKTGQALHTVPVATRRPKNDCCGHTLED